MWAISFAQLYLYRVRARLISCAYTNIVTI